MSLAPLMSSAQHDWRTPRALFDAVQAGCDVDAAADAENALCPRWFGPGSPIATDALSVPAWSDHGACFWLNPPYGRMLPRFAETAIQQVNRSTQIEVWMLVPARVDTRWWNLLMTRALSVRFIAGRVTFEQPGNVKNPAPFPSAVIRLSSCGGDPTVTWGWRPQRFAGDAAR